MNLTWGNCAQKQAAINKLKKIFHSKGKNLSIQCVWGHCQAICQGCPLSWSAKLNVCTWKKKKHYSKGEMAFYDLQCLQVVQEAPASSSKFSLVMNSFVKSYSASDSCVALAGVDTFLSESLGWHSTAINTGLLLQYFSTLSLFLYNSIKNTLKYS